MDENVYVDVDLYRDDAQEALCPRHQQGGLSYTPTKVVQSPIDLVGGPGTEGGLVHRPMGKQIVPGHLIRL